jgi:prolipoprotein diacylglyceryltransferase
MSIALPFNIFWLLYLAGVAFWVWMLYECLAYEPSDGNEKLNWLLVLIFTNFIGALLYFFIRRQNRIRTHGR